MTSYRERLGPGWWMVLATGLVFPATLLILLPLNVAIGVASGLILWGGTLALLWLSSPVITVDSRLLEVGTARLERSFIASVESLSGEQARHAKGPGAHGRAWLCLRPWVHPVVKITLSDPEDPTPYWLVSSRTPDLLKSALDKN
ncbi:DUF3093 domain-containing protein [Pontimonas sp.]|nr:DUF3093 domain-containing protein [Pontimonas sp.]